MSEIISPRAPRLQATCFSQAPEE